MSSRFTNVAEVIKQYEKSIKPDAFVSIMEKIGALNSSTCKGCANRLALQCGCGALYCNDCCGGGSGELTRCGMKMGTLKCTSAICSECEMQCGSCRTRVCKSCTSLQQWRRCVSCKMYACAACCSNCCDTCEERLCDDCLEPSNAAGTLRCVDCIVDADEKTDPPSKPRWTEKSGKVEKKRKIGRGARSEKKKVAAAQEEEKKEPFDPRDDWVPWE